MVYGGEAFLLNRYLDDLKKLGVQSTGLSRQEEKSLVQRMKNGDPEARNQLIRTQLVLVFKKAKDYKLSADHFGLMDLVQEGNRALVELLNSGKFQPAKGTLGGYLSCRIQWRILYLLREASRKNRLAKRIRERESAGADFVEAVDEKDWLESRWRQVRSAIDKLPARNKKIIRWRFGLADGKPRSFLEISRRLGMDKVTVRMVVHRFFKKIRSLFADPEI